MENQTLEQVLDELGITARAEARGEARGEARKAQEFAQYLIKKGWAGEEIAEATKLDLPTVESLTAAG